MSTPEELFVRKALAKAERAARFSQIKRIVIVAIALPAVFVVAGGAPEHKGSVTTAVMVGFMLAAATAKLSAQISSSTRTIVKAIAELPQK